MKIAVFTDECRHRLFTSAADRLAVSRKSTRMIFYDLYDDFLSGLPDSGCEAVIVARDGADGMESARAAKILLPEIPLIWFSDDNGFGPESYRVGCAYFSAASLTEEIIEKAIDRVF